MKNLHILLIYAIILANTCFAQFKQETSIVKKNLFSQSNFNLYESRSSAQADTTVIWCEDFENGLSGNNDSNAPWTVSGSDGSVWAFDTDGSNGQFNGDNPYTLESTTFENGWMIFDADLSNPRIPAQFNEKNGSLVSPYIDLSSNINVTLKFENAFRWCCGNDHELLVGISTDNGLSWEDIVINQNYIPNELVTTHETNIIISEYAGGEDSVLIRFDWGGSEQTASHYFWILDDVSIVETPEYSSEIDNPLVALPSSLYGLSTYSRAPIPQTSIAGYFFGGTITNQGVNDLVNARIVGEITSESFIDESEGITLGSSLDSILFTSNGFIPPSVGSYEGSIYGTDDNNTNTETRQVGFIVTEYEYARDRADFSESGNFGFRQLNDLGSVQLGNTYDIFSEEAIYSIKVYIDEETNQNALARGILNLMNDQGEPEFIEQSELINVGQFRGQWVDLILVSPYIAGAGQTIGASVQAEGSDPLLVIGEIGISSPGGSYLLDIDGTNQGGGPGQLYNASNTPMIRLNFDPSLAEEPASINNEFLFDYSIYPNPNDGQFKLNLANENSKDLNLSIQNILGQEIYKESFQSVSSLSKNIDLSYLEKGIYHITISDEENKSQTQKIIIQ